MAWLTSLLNRPETTEDERAPSEQDTLAAEEAAARRPAPGSPPLAILSPDIGGISSFSLRFFADAATAAADIEQLTPEMRRGTHAFWALHDEPVLPPDGHREALVLIRANHTSDIVYAVSFVDLESAWSFARFEAKRGLDVSHLIILWAAFATVREELDGVSVLPASAPATRAQHARAYPGQSAVELAATETVREYERAEEPTITDSAAAPEAPEEAGLAEAETERREEAARARLAEAETGRREEAARRAEADEAARIARQAQEELRAARAAADAARAVAEAETTRREEAERRLEEQRQAAEAAARSRVLADMESRIESAQTASETTAEGLVVLDETSAALQDLAEAQAQPLIEDASATAEVPADSALEVGDEPPPRGTVFAHAHAVETAEDTETAEAPDLHRADEPGDPADDAPKHPKLDDFDIAYEVARLLENRRWDKREEPFHGFDSPPGKF